MVGAMRGSAHGLRLEPPALHLVESLAAAVHRECLKPMSCPLRLSFKVLSKPTGFGLRFRRGCPALPTAMGVLPLHVELPAAPKDRCHPYPFFRRVAGALGSALR